MTDLPHMVQFDRFCHIQSSLTNIIIYGSLWLIMADIGLVWMILTHTVLFDWYWHIGLVWLIMLHMVQFDWFCHIQSSLIDITVYRSDWLIITNMGLSDCLYMVKLRPTDLYVVN